MFKDNYLKIGVILLVLLQPIIIVSVFGLDFKSYSKCWNTPLEPLYILSNASASYFFYSIKRWRVPAFSLMLLTIFSTEQYSDVHNFFAIVFFLSVFYSLAEFKKLRVYLYLYSFSIVVGLLSGILFFEWYSSYIICFYHLNILYLANKFKNRHNNLQN